MCSNVQEIEWSHVLWVVLRSQSLRRGLIEGGASPPRINCSKAIAHLSFVAVEGCHSTLMENTHL